VRGDRQRGDVVVGQLDPRVGVPVDGLREQPQAGHASLGPVLPGPWPLGHPGLRPGTDASTNRLCLDCRGRAERTHGTLAVRQDGASPDHDLRGQR
jgi:hypothetical protein